MNKYTIHTKLNSIIPYIPFVKQGKYNGYSIILIGGSGYESTMFNSFFVDKNDNFYRKFNYETEFPNINFQKRLSKNTLTFSFDRPTDLLNHNLYNDRNHKHIYIASKKDLTIENYAKFINKLLQYHKIKPSYVFVGFSEGGYDILCFSKYYSKFINSIYFIDTPFLEKFLLQFEIYRNNEEWYKNILNNKLTWNTKSKTTKDDLISIDVYNIEIKTLNIILNLKISDIPDKPIYLLWSPYFDNPLKKDKTKYKNTKGTK